MSRILFFLSFIPLLVFSSCEDENNHQIQCTEEARAGLNVTVSLGASSTHVGKDITVVAKDGDYSETLTYYNEQDPIFSGAIERPGNYVLTVSKVSYKTYSSGVISVTSDVCHVIPQQIHVILLPE